MTARQTKRMVAIDMSKQGDWEAQAEALVEGREQAYDLDVSRNLLSAHDARAVARLLRRSTQLHTLELGENELGRGGVISIASALCVNTTLRVLHLEANELGVDGARALGRMLGKNNTLACLYLGNNDLGDSGMEKLGVGLIGNRGVQVLGLEDNDIGYRGVVVLAAVLVENTRLHTVNLDGNNMGDFGAMLLGDALVHNHTVQRLDLSNNGVGDDGLDRLGKALSGGNTDVWYLGHSQELCNVDGVRENRWMVKTMLEMVDRGDAVAVAWAVSELNVSVNAFFEDRTTPLMRAVQRGDVRMANMLRRLGADADLTAEGWLDAYSARTMATARAWRPAWHWLWSEDVDDAVETVLVMEAVGGGAGGGGAGWVRVGEMEVLQRVCGWVAQFVEGCERRAKGRGGRNKTHRGVRGEREDQGRVGGKRQRVGE